MGNLRTPYPGEGALPPRRPRSWFDRNWKWMVPVLFVVVVLAVAGFVGIILWAVEESIHSSYPYKYAVQRATESADVAEKIGSPFKTGWFTTGRINVHNNDGVAFFRIPVVGARANGTIVVNARKHAGRWTFQTLQVEVDGEAQPIELEGGEPLHALPNPAKST